MKTSAEKRTALLKQLAQYAEFVRGSITSVCAACNRGRCICQRPRARRAYRLTYKDRQQKTRIVYVAAGRLPRVRTLLANYGRIRALIEQLVETNIEVFKAETAR